MGKRVVDESSLTQVADAIRAANGTTAAIEFPDGMASSIESIAEAHMNALGNKTVTEIVGLEWNGTVWNSFQSGNKNLLRVDLPKVTALKSSCFNACTNLASVNLQAVKTVESDSFSSCWSLTQLYMPSLETVTGWGYTFAGCYGISKIYFPKLKSMHGGAEFNGCTRLDTLILGANEVCTLTSNSQTFNGTAIMGQGGKTGYIYVPAALIDQYKVATNWASFADKFRAIEDYPEVLEGWE